MRLVASSIIAFVLIAQVACGDGSGSSGAKTNPATPVNPGVCSLLTVTEIQEIAGINDPAVQNRDRPDFPSYECYWSKDAESVDVTLVRLAGDATPNWNPGAEEIKGLAKYAQYYAEPLPILDVWNGDWYIQVSPSSFQITQSHSERDASVKLARLILGRLG